MSSRIAIAVSAAAALALIPVREARAESVRAAVANHLARELPASGSQSGDGDGYSGGTGGSASNADDSVADPPAEPDGTERTEPAPPVVTRPGARVFGRPAYLDVSFQTRMQVWLPAQHPSVHLSAAPIRTFSIELAGGIAGLVSLHRLALETDGTSWIGSWRGTVAPSLGDPGASAAAALVMIGLPLLRLGSATWWEPIVRYEVSNYATTATPSRPICLVARGADTSVDPPACAPADGPLRMASRFESWLVGVHFGRAGVPAFADLGVDLVRQRKPYQINVDGRTLDDFLFDARFGGAGLGLGFGIGSDQGLNVRGGVHFGAAWVSLTDDLPLDDVLPAGWGVRYFRWDASLGYGLVLWKGPPSLQLRAAVDGSGSHFNYAREGSDETPSLSRDLFFGGRLALTLML
jgi:hypothetical protein